MNTESFDAISCLNYNERVKIGKGAFSFDEAKEIIFLVMPREDRTLMTYTLRISTEPYEAGIVPPVWNWNGDLLKPTLIPSINNIGDWHGHLTNGRFKSC